MHFADMSTLLEIKTAVDSLSAQEQQELLLSLATRLLAAGGFLPSPRDISNEQMNQWITEDEAGYAKFLAGA